MSALWLLAIPVHSHFHPTPSPPHQCSLVKNFLLLSSPTLLHTAKFFSTVKRECHSIFWATFAPRMESATTFSEVELGAHLFDAKRIWNDLLVGGRTSATFRRVVIRDNEIDSSGFAQRKQEQREKKSLCDTPDSTSQSERGNGIEWRKNERRHRLLTRYFERREVLADLHFRKTENRDQMDCRRTKESHCWATKKTKRTYEMTWWIAVQPFLSQTEGSA